MSDFPEKVKSHTENLIKTAGRARASISSRNRHGRKFGYFSLLIWKKKKNYDDTLRSVMEKVSNMKEWMHNVARKTENLRKNER